MIERRHNWKACVSKAAQARQEKRQGLIIQLDTIRRQIQNSRLNFDLHDQLYANMREIVAQLATLTEA